MARTAIACKQPDVTLRASVQVLASCRLDYCNSVLAASLRFVFIASWVRQLVWSPALLVMTTSSRFLRHFIGFEFLRKLSSRRLFLYRSVYTRRSAMLLGRPVCAGGNYGRSSSVTLYHDCRGCKVSGAVLVSWTLASAALLCVVLWNRLPI